MAGLAAIMDAIAASLDPLAGQIPGLQVTARQNPTPTPPSLDVYLDAPSARQISEGGWEEMFVVRARVTTPDDVAAQEVLMSMMDVDGPTSVIAALYADRTLGGTVGGLAIDELSGFQAYPGDFLGCEWRVRTIQ